MPARRVNSIDDMQPFEKDNLSSSSPMKYISSTNIDEERGILTSSPNNHEVGTKLSVRFPQHLGFHLTKVLVTHDVCTCFA